MFKKFIPIMSLSFALASNQFALKLFASETSEKNQTPNQESTKKSSIAKKKRNVSKRTSVSIALGKKIYKQYQCFDCHSIAGKGCKDGMKLDAIGSKRTKTFIREHIVDPDKHFDQHPTAFGTDLNLMPPQNLEPYEVDSLVEYLHSLK